jgi:glycosyltransferase involved in cell wall biosynthesis
VEPRDVEGIAAAIRRLRDEPDLRADLIRRGLLQAQKFDWGKTAQAILQVATESQ